MKRFIVPIFIPNLSCPTRCVFCDQGLITSERSRLPAPEQIKEILSQAVGSRSYRKENENQVAFYGGTFTGLGTERIRALLEAVSPFLKRGLFKGIRVSTRPDMLSDEKLELMRCCGVKLVELGAQAMDDEVLEASNRGHTVKDTVEGLRKLRDKGFSVGIQLMPGLPRETEDSFKQTIRKTLELRPDCVRLYPTVVIQGTELARLYRQGVYKPLGLDEAVERCAWAVRKFEGAGIPVIRIGLMSSQSLMRDGSVVAGPWHPSLGHLVRARIFQKKILDSILGAVKGKQLLLSVHPNDISFLKGFKGQGARYLESSLGAEIVSVTIDKAIGQGEARVQVI